MNRSQSTLSSILDGNKETNKRSLWGTLRSKRRVTDDSSRRKSSNAIHRLSVSSSTMTITSGMASTNTGDHLIYSDIRSNHSNNNNNILNNTNNNDNDINIHNNSISTSNNNLTDIKTNNSTSVSLSSVNSQRLSSTTSSHSYSLDPHANRDSESGYSSSRNSMYSARSTSLLPPSRTEIDKKSYRNSRIFDSELFEVEEPYNNTRPTRTVRDVSRNSNKRHSVMFGKSSVPQDFLKTLQQIPSNEENFIPTSTKEANRLSLTFEDYKLALEVYGYDDDNTELMETISKSPDVSINSSPFVTDYEELDDKVDIKIYSNCIWIGSCHSFTNSDNKEDPIVNAKVNKIDVKVNDDLDGIFNEDDDEEDRRVVQRTSLYFT